MCYASWNHDKTTKHVDSVGMQFLVQLLKQSVSRKSSLSLTAGIKTSLRGACLSGTDLRGVDLSEVEGLNAEQLKDAITDEATKLPSGLERQLKIEGV